MVLAGSNSRHNCIAYFGRSNKNNMPPKTLKPNDASDLHVAMPSNHGVINTSPDTHDDPFSYPNVTTMAIAKLKSEPNRLQVCIVGNPIKTTLLVCLDYGRCINGGGDFGFGLVGHVL